MPLYEFYCRPCHTIFTFRAPRVDTKTVPSCPVCGGALSRQVSLFAHCVKGKHAEAPAEDGGAAERMDRMMAEMGDKVDSLADDEADPRAAVSAMRAMAEAGGVHFNKDVREAFARIEAGEDPERVEEQFHEVFETENPFDESGDGEAAARSLAWWRRLAGPKRDPRWYDWSEGKDEAP